MADTTPVIEALLAEHADLERQLPILICTPMRPPPAGSAGGSPRSRRSLRRTASSRLARGDLEAARELGADDESFAAEVPELESTVDTARHPTDRPARPRDPHDGDDIVLEVKSGEGGEESALFAADLARMYIRYAERHGWTVAVLDETTLGPRRLQGRDVVDQKQG